MGICTTFLDTINIFSIICCDPFKQMLRCCFSKRRKVIKGEIVLITGAGQGLGKELARQLSELDPVLVLWDINEEGNNEVANEIRLSGHKVHAYKVDVTNLAEVTEVAHRVREEVGDVTVLVNNAGVFSGYPLISIPEHIIKRSFDVNVMGHFWILQQFLPRMIELNKGHVVAVASMAGHVGVANMTDYCASKHAAVGMMNSLYMELRAAKKRIKLTTINPVIISTGLISNTQTRFPSLMPLLDVKTTAEEIIDSILAEADEIFLPKRAFWLLFCTNLFSRRTQFEIFEYIGYGFDSQKHVQGKGYDNPSVQEV